MAELMLAMFVEEATVQVVMGGLSILVDIKERIETAFTHAKTRTARLCEAAQIACHFVRAFEATVGKMNVVFDERQHLAFKSAFEKLRRVVQHAEYLMLDLENKSKAKWFLYGNTYREKITKATYDLAEAGQQLSNLLSSASTEVGLNILEKVNAMHAEEEEEDEQVHQSELSERDILEVAAIVSAQHTKFTSLMAAMVQNTRAKTDRAVKNLRAANDQQQRSMLLLARMDRKLTTHADVRNTMDALQLQAWHQLRTGIAKALKTLAIPHSRKTVASEEQLTAALGHAFSSYDFFKECFRACDRARLCLATDNPVLMTNVNVAWHRLSTLNHDFVQRVQNALRSYARDPNTDTDEVQSYFTQSLKDVRRHLADVVNTERKQLIIDVHKFLYSTNFVESAIREATELAEPAEPKQNDDDEPETGRTEQTPTQFEYEEPMTDVFHTPQEALDRARRKVDEFVECTDGVVRCSNRPVTQEEMMVLKGDLEIVAVHIACTQTDANVDLERQVVDSVRDLAEVFTSLPPSVSGGPNQASVDLSSLRLQLEGIDAAIQALTIAQTPLHFVPSQPTSRRNSFAQDLYAM